MNETGERPVPSHLGTLQGVEHSHLVRYLFALKYVENRTVLDCACSLGYGTRLLAEKAESVQGWDYSAAAIEMAQQHYQTSNAVFYVVDAEKEFPKNKKFNAVVSFETIEHLESPEHFINEVAKILTEDGRLVLSTPFVDFRGFSGRKFHKKEMTSRQLYKLLSQRFSHIQFFIQPAAGDYILPFWRRFFEDCSTAQTSIVAVCSNAPLPVSSSSLKNLGRTYFNGIVKRKVKDLLIGMGLSDLKSKR